ncbi:citryl-CoA lyase [Mycolicibacterium septicum DSM 44393]|uniref:citrate synthase (unknown stereospecificity) n=1 Tax=Mycolicibacterium septicum DSM 44393 TaxID=1341646 RepID=A0A7X6MLI9_9MYCO|nr:citryl-CoA lyase [Mycolicibacterium septicum]NKZ10805.1 citryl-CoA lyase [Mycolicibacterium septicum DSM 44393]
MSTAREDAVMRTSSRDVTDWWTTKVSDIEPGVIRLRGYPIEQLISGASFAELIWLMIRGDFPAPADAQLLERALVAAVDHGPQAPSIAAARMAVTCGVGLQGAMSTGVGLLGDVHGGAGQQCMELLKQIRAESKNGDLASVVAQTITHFRSSGRYIPGFGHRFHPRDPRRDPLMTALHAHVEAGAIGGHYVAIAEELENQLAGRRGQSVPMNVDGATAVVYAELGFAPELGRGLFIMSRAVGILAHAWEELGNGTRIKGPIPPPLLPTYVGPPERTIPGTTPRADPS